MIEGSHLLGRSRSVYMPGLAINKTDQIFIIYLGSMRKWLGPNSAEGEMNYFRRLTQEEIARYLEGRIRKEEDSKT